MANGHTLDLLLINPNSKAKVYQSLSKELSAIEPPVWAGLMGTYVRGKGYSVQILDAEAEHLSPAEIAARVTELRPRLATVVVYGHQPSASTQNMTAAGQACTAIKDTSSTQPVLMVGGHVASLPERTMQEERTDFVATGEGLLTQTALLQALAAPVPNFSNVPDLWYRENGALRQSAVVAPLIKDLDHEMPGIAWDLLPMDKYRAHNWHCLGHLTRQPYVAIYTTLGCPYHCSFCCIQAPFKSGEKQLGMKETANSYRFWSPKLVVDDLERLVRQFGLHNVKFADEMFVLNPRHVAGICDEITRRGLKLNIWAYARVDTVRDEMVDKLKQAGINWLAFGIEAANAKVRDEVQKGFDQDDIYRTLKRVEKAGLYVIGNYIFGLPEDDHQTMQQTLDMALDLNCEFANFYCAMAYPGSALYQTARREGWALPKTWTGYSQHSVDTLPLPTKHLTAAEVLRFRDNAFNTYYTNPRYLDLVRQKFGEPTVQHLREMTTHKLERRYA